MVIMTQKEFADEARFAKVVNTEAGDALLIAGMVFHVSGPMSDAASHIAAALRGPSRGDTEGKLVSGTGG